MMKNMNENALLTVARSWQLIALSTILLSITGCGEVDENDGTIVNSINLPTDSSLTLYCPDAGVAGEPCILDDPENPYAITPVHDDNKFQLSDVAPSSKARFYLWGTAQAMSPRGENQYHVALALQGMYNESGSTIARDQALRAYRSVLDNYYEDVWFFKYPAPPAPTEFLWPKKVRLLTINNLWLNPEVGYDPLFTSELAALQQLGEWGYTYESATGDVYRN